MSNYIIDTTNLRAVARTEDDDKANAFCDSYNKGEPLLIDCAEHLSSLKGQELVALHNAHHQGADVKKFSNKDTAMSRTFAAIELDDTIPPVEKAKKGRKQAAPKPESESDSTPGTRGTRLVVASDAVVSVGEEKAKPSTVFGWLQAAAAEKSRTKKQLTDHMVKKYKPRNAVCTQEYAAGYVSFGLSHGFLAVVEE